MDGASIEPILQMSSLEDVQGIMGAAKRELERRYEERRKTCKHEDKQRGWIEDPSPVSKKIVSGCGYCLTVLGKFDEPQAEATKNWVQVEAGPPYKVWIGNQLAKGFEEDGITVGQIGVDVAEPPIIAGPVTFFDSPPVEVEPKTE